MSRLSIVGTFGAVVVVVNGFCCVGRTLLESWSFYVWNPVVGMLLFRTRNTSRWGVS